MLRKTALVLAAVLMLTAAGCADGKSSCPDSALESNTESQQLQETAQTDSQTDSQPDSQSDSAAEQTGTSGNDASLSADSQAPVNQLPLDGAIKPLRCLSVSGTVKSCFAGQGDTVVVQYGTEKKQQFAVVDIRNDRITASGTLSNAEEIAAGITPDGELVSPEYRYTIFTGTIRFYKDGKSRSVTIPETLRKLTYSAADRKIYAYDYASHSVRTISESGESAELFKLPNRCKVCIFCPERSLFLAEEPCAEKDIMSAEVCRSLKNGSIISRGYSGDNAEFGFTNGKYFCEMPDPDEETGIEPRHSLSYVYAADGTQICGYSFADEANDYEMDQIGDIRAAYTGSICFSGKTASALRFTDLAAGKSVLLDFPETGVEAAKLCYAADAGVWAAAYSCNNGGKSVTKLCLADPEVPDTASPAPAAKLIVPGTTHSCGEALAQVRQVADIIEKKHGVRILIGDEAFDINLRSTSKLTSTEAGFSDAKAQCDFLLRNLYELDETMSLYPEGFFRSFRMPDGEGGIRLTFVSGLQVDGMGEAGGQARVSGAWYNILMCNAEVFNHEMFHAVESRLESAAPDGLPFAEFGSDSWAKLQPPGFHYLFNWETYSSNTSVDPYLVSSGSENAYFVNRYCTTDGSEDRADLIAFVLGSPYVEWVDGPTKNGMEIVLKCPHLLAKLDFIKKRVQAEFGSVYWEQIIGAGYDALAFDGELREQTVQSILSHYHIS